MFKTSIPTRRYSRDSRDTRDSRDSRDSRDRDRRDTRDSRDSRNVFDLEGFNPDVKLEYKDEHGRSLNKKEAWRQMSHAFHGKVC